MKVIIELIEGCSGCRFQKPYHSGDDYIYYICVNPLFSGSRKIDKYPIPDWCPLPNREDAKEMIA